MGHSSAFISSRADQDNLVRHQHNTRDLVEMERISQIRTFNGKEKVQSLTSYIDTIGDIRLLSASEERELALRAQEGDLVARNLLTITNLKLVASIAKKYRDRGLPLIDLVQDGSIGLMTSVRKFDPSRGFRFSTYASWWIRESITRALSNRSRMVRLPVHVIELMTKIRRVRSQLMLLNDCEPTTLEIATAVNETLGRTERALDCSRTCISVEEKTSNEEERGATIGETVTDRVSKSPEEFVDSLCITAQIDKLLAGLSERERIVVLRRFGLGGYEEQSLREISADLGLSRDQVGKVSSFAMRKLKVAAQIEQFEDYLR